MLTYNKEKTKILTDYDIDKGYLKEDTLITHHKEVEAVEEEGHYEVIKEYANGGKDVKWIIDKEGVEHKDAYDEVTNIYVYIPYSERELKMFDINEKISNLQSQLSSTDYQAIKYFEGWYTDEEYEPIKQNRESIREEIRKLEKELEEYKEVEDI